MTIDAMPKAGENSLRFQVVTTLEELMHVFAIRAITWMEEKEMPADHAMDENDYQCTHVLAYSGDEPVGCLRIRWFRDFAKIERSTYRKSHRNIRTIIRAAKFVFSHIARKGYSTVVTHAEPEYAELWTKMLGFQRIEKPAAEYFGISFVELSKELPPDPCAITLQDSVEVLYRPEGKWDRPAKYEARQ